MEDPERGALASCGGGDEEVGVVDGLEVKQGAGLEDEAESVLVGRQAYRGRFQARRWRGEGRATPGVGPDEGVVGAHVRGGIWSNRWRASERLPLATCSSSC